MSKRDQFLRIPILEEGSGQVRGGFCSTREVVSEAESAALARIKLLHQQATLLKARLKQAPAAEHPSIQAELDAVRQEAAQWRERKALATQEKHRRLGHTRVTLDG